MLPVPGCKHSDAKQRKRLQMKGLQILLKTTMTCSNCMPKFSKESTKALRLSTASTVASRRNLSPAYYR